MPLEELKKKYESFPDKPYKKVFNYFASRIGNVRSLKDICKGTGMDEHTAKAAIKVLQHFHYEELGIEELHYNDYIFVHVDRPFSLLRGGLEVVRQSKDNIYRMTRFYLKKKNLNPDVIYSSGGDNIYVSETYEYLGNMQQVPTEWKTAASMQNCCWNIDVFFLHGMDLMQGIPARNEYERHVETIGSGDIEEITKYTIQSLNIKQEKVLNFETENLGIVVSYLQRL